MLNAAERSCKIRPEKKKWLKELVIWKSLVHSARAILLQWQEKESDWS